MIDLDMGVRPEHGTLRVRSTGAQVSVKVWETGRAGPELVLVHGGASGKHWWDHVVPALRGAGRVVAPDLTGHGDSDHRAVYGLDEWADELAETTSALCGPAPLAVGHSMGGLIATGAAQRHPGLFSGILALDSPLARDNPGNAERRRKIASRPVRSYDSFEAALKEFRTSPPVVDAPADVVRHVAAHSVRPDGERWRLKYDPRIYDRPQAPADYLHPAQVPTWWLRAEHGFIDDEMAEVITSSLGPQGRMLWGSGATHHMVLDQPLPTTWLINAFIDVVGR